MQESEPRTMAIVLPDELHVRIKEALQATYPNEGGGFLLGRSNAAGVTMLDSTPVENVFEQEEQYHRYAMTPVDWMRMEDEAEARGLSLVVRALPDPAETRAADAALRPGRRRASDRDRCSGRPGRGQPLGRAERAHHVCPGCPGPAAPGELRRGWGGQAAAAVTGRLTHNQGITLTEEKTRW